MTSQKGTFVTGDGRVLNVKEIADVYRNCVNLATPSKGKIQRIDDNYYSLSCHFTTVDCDSLETIETSKSYLLKTFLKDSEKCIESVNCATDSKRVDGSIDVTSNNGRFVARIRSPNSEGGEQKQFLELWDRSRLLKTINVAELPLHGAINIDSAFGSMSWSPDGEQNKLIYVCQKKRSKYHSFFKQTMPKVGQEKEEAENQMGKKFNLGEDFDRVDDWGERLTGIAHTFVAMMEVENDFKISIVDVDGYSLGDVKWLSDMKTVSVAYLEKPKRLGVFCSNNRPSELVVHDWSQSSPVEILRLKRENYSFHSPRVDHSGQKFLYLTNKTFGPHLHPVRMNIYDLNSKLDRELSVDSTKETELFMEELVKNCFTTDDRHILFTSFDHLNRSMCLYDLTEHKITKIKFPTTGLTVLDFKHDLILAKGAEVNATPTLFVAALNSMNPGELVAWHQIEDCIHLDEIDYETYNIPSPDGSTFISAYLVSPNFASLHENFNGDSQDKTQLVANQFELPTVVVIHGGPHTTNLIDYFVGHVFLARMGLKILLINYRGSTGVSQDYSLSLCGKIGELDVADCLHVIRRLVADKVINPNKLVLLGGSHGGFLACHLSCQEEFKFKSAVIRNPVVDLASNHSTSDMPDWIFAEGLGHQTFDHTKLPSSKDLVDLYERSPTSKFTLANVPTLMMLGNKDRRVSKYHGERWIELLKARGLKTKCKVYDDNHSLAKVETAADGSMTAIIWILSNL